jgi:hypothetical protein
MKRIDKYIEKEKRTHTRLPNEQSENTICDGLKINNNKGAIHIV